MLEKHGLDVDTVESAAEALDYLATRRPDAIFMDHMMPGMDGFQAVKAIKANPKTATIPVMMYTSKGGDLYIGQARALGAVGVLPKTVAPAQLFESLRKIGLVGERRKRDRSLDEDDASERAEDIPETGGPALAIPPFDEPGMPETGQELKPGQLDQLRHDLADLRGQVEVLMNQIQVGEKRQKDLYLDIDNLHHAGIK